MSIVYSIKEASELIKVNPVIVRHAIKSGKLKAAAIGTKDWRISRHDLETWYQSMGGGRLFEESPPAIKAALKELLRLRKESPSPSHPYDNLTDEEIFEQIDSENTPTLTEPIKQYETSAREPRDKSQASGKPQKEEEKTTTIRRTPVKRTES